MSQSFLKYIIKKSILFTKLRRFVLILSIFPFRMKSSFTSSFVVAIAFLCIVSLNSNLYSEKSISVQTTSRLVDYKDKDVTLEGYLSMPVGAQTMAPNSLPGILLIHEWTGLGEYIKKRADMYASLGYVVFAMDMYGKGKRAKNHDEAAKLMNIYEKNPILMNERVQTSLDFLKKNRIVNINKIVVVGYCFGGGVALRLAYTGTPLRGLISFHGMIRVPLQQEAKNVRANQTKIMIHHGEADTFIPKETIEKFKERLEQNKVDYEFFSYPGAVHGFTRWQANESSGIQYNKNADKESWNKTVLFLEALKKE